MMDPFVLKLVLANIAGEIFGCWLGITLFRLIERKYLNPKAERESEARKAVIYARMDEILRKAGYE